MTASKHERTKGPWALYSRGSTVAVCIGEDADGKRPCIIDWPGFDSCGLSLDEQKANAAFIVRACNSHDAMVEALEKSEAVMTIVEPRGHKAEYLDALESIRSALSLAKTEGQP